MPSDRARKVRPSTCCIVNDAPAAHPCVDGVILAGGRARRMDGRDKGLLTLRGHPLVEWVARRLAPQVGTLAISANRNLEAYAALGCPVVTDELPDHPGPLAGILAAGGRLNAEWLLVVPCDLPFLPDDLVERLLGAATAQGLTAVYAAEPEREHYAVMLIHRDRLADMAEHVAAGGRQVRAWLAAQGARGVMFPAAGAAFFNINTPEDLEQAESLAATGSDMFRTGA